MGSICSAAAAAAAVAPMSPANNNSHWLTSLLALLSLSLPCSGCSDASITRLPITVRTIVNSSAERAGTRALAHWLSRFIPPHRPSSINHNQSDPLPLCIPSFFPSLPSLHASIATTTSKQCSSSPSTRLHDHIHRRSCSGAAAKCPSFTSLINESIRRYQHCCALRRA